MRVGQIVWIYFWGTYGLLTEGDGPPTKCVRGIVLSEPFIFEDGDGYTASPGDEVYLISLQSGGMARLFKTSELHESRL